MRTGKKWSTAEVAVLEQFRGYSLPHIARRLEERGFGQRSITEIGYKLYWLDDMDCLAEEKAVKLALILDQNRFREIESLFTLGAVVLLLYRSLFFGGK